MTDAATVIIEVEDVNDNAPLFRQCNMTAVLQVISEQNMYCISKKDFCFNMFSSETEHKHRGFIKCNYFTALKTEFA